MKSYDHLLHTPFKSSSSKRGPSEENDSSLLVCVSWAAVIFVALAVVLGAISRAYSYRNIQNLEGPAYNTTQTEPLEI